MKTPTNLSVAELKRALALRERIETLQEELQQVLGGSTTGVEKPQRKRKMSAAGRERIRAAQKARWAKQKAGTSHKGK